MRKNSNAYFWTSYSDLMTSLFFIMLALFAITYALLASQKKVLEEQLAKIHTMEQSVLELEKTGRFIYQSEYKRFVLKEQVVFERESADIKPGYRPGLITVGKDIINLVNRTATDPNIRYLILIEGMASADRYGKNYELSYARALELYRLWTSPTGGDLHFDPAHTEVLISGSGTGGVGRAKNEVENQRFLIQIIPKFKLK